MLLHVLAQHVVQRAKNAVNTSVLSMIAKGSDMNVNLTIFIIIFIQFLKNTKTQHFTHSTTQNYRAPGGAEP